jgi:glycosyltransferase involved in cell wall biosynthesis
MTPLAIAVVTTYYRPVLGGAETAAERLATFLVRRGHRVTVLTKRTSMSSPALEVLDGVEVHRLNPVGERSSLGKWKFLPSLYRALTRRADEIDVVCCVDYRGIGLAALAARSRTRTPVVFQAQTEGVLSGARVRDWFEHVGVNPSGLMARLATWPIRASYGRVDAIGCISHGIEREALAEGVPRERVHYLPNPVDARRFAPAGDAERRRLRERLGIAPDAVVAAFVGRLSREKGAVELVKAWAMARPIGRLAMIGPPMTDHPWDVSAEVRALVAAHQLEDSVRLLGGLPADRVAEWLQASDFSIQPSHFEAMGLAAAEAMAAGLPVIASDTGGYRDFIITEQNGLLVPTKDVPALSAAIGRLAADPVLRQRLGTQARLTAEQFDEALVLGRFERVVADLAAARVRRRT